jgi:transposase InsO family protein
LHKNDTTTPAVRATIQQSSANDYELARQYGVSRQTIRRWRKRNSVLDASHTPHRLQTTLNAAQEELVIYLRSQLRLSLDDLLAVVHEFIEPGYVHLDVKDLPQMADETARRDVFVAIDRATRWAFIALKSHKTAAAAKSFLNALHKAAPFRVHTLLTDNGQEFTDHQLGARAKDASGLHAFDALREALGIEHRLTRPKSPQTHGMVERFNGRLEQVLRSHHFNSAQDLATTLHRYVWLYNEHLPQKALEHLTPLQAMKRWRSSHPHLFSKKVRNHPGPDSYAPFRHLGAVGPLPRG